MEDKILVNNIFIYIEKEIAEDFSSDSIIWWVEEYEGTNNNPLYMYDFFYSYDYTKLCIHYFCLSNNN